MRLNRERAAAGLCLLILVFGLYGMLKMGVSPPPPPIPTDPPPSTQEVLRLEPRLYVEDAGGDRNPFLLASDWLPLVPEALPAPPPEATRWLVIPPGRGPDPAEAGFLFLREPPAEVKPELEEGKEKAEEKKP